LINVKGAGGNNNFKVKQRYLFRDKESRMIKVLASTRVVSIGEV
jgi:hypothetical protein